ncbi:hypothetical protein Goari_003057, partial [Gossypium aridum]|nr:hypothetical protein [Gossypium aridum]
ACDVDNFFVEDGKHLSCQRHHDDAVKVNTGSMFLTDIVLLWWLSRSTDKRQSDIGMWQEFQCELKGQFYPEFTEEEAQERL